MTAAWLEPPAGLAEPALPGAQDAFGFDLVALLLFYSASFAYCIR